MTKKKGLIKIILFVLAAVLCWSTFAGLFHTKPQQGSNNTNTHQTTDEPENPPDNPPPEEPELIIDPVLANNSWETIKAAFRAGVAADYWNLGDTKEIELADGYTYEVQIVDMTPNRYALSDGTGYSNGVLQFVMCLATDRQMNATNTNVGGWADCAMRTALNTTVYNQLPDDLKAVISEVSVESGVGNETTSGTSTSNNKLFLASEYEIFGAKIYSIGASEGSPQFGYWALHNSNADRIKTKINSTLAQYWWLRSPYSGNSALFCDVNYAGDVNVGNAHDSSGVCPCFAL